MPRNNPSAEDRRRLIDSFEREEDFIFLASQLGINRRTAYGIIKRYRETGRVEQRNRGGAHNVKFDEEMKDVASEFIELNPVITLKELNAKIRQRLPEKPQVSVSTLATAVDGMLYTVKAISDIPQGRNSDATKELRRQYATWMTVNAVDENIFIDECGFNVFTRRSRGRALRGTPAVRKVKGQRGKNITVCLAISQRLGVVHHRIMEGGMMRDIFIAFLTELSQLIGEDIRANLIFDNVRAHFDVPNPSENHVCVHLPPYSPQLNPIELAFSTFKASIKQRLAQVQDDFVNPPPGVNLTQHRRRMLTGIAVEALPVITPEMCANFYNHSRRYLPISIAGMDFPN